MNSTTNTTNTQPADAGNLTTELRSAVFIPMEASKKHKLAAGNRWCKLIKKGENSKLGQSVAIEVPALTAAQAAAMMQNAGIKAAVHAYLEELENIYIKSRAIAGAASIQYSEITPDNIAAAIAESGEALGQLSGERITNWFESDARELLIVALADRLGLSDTATEQDIKRLEQIANQTRDNLVKLASRKPVIFDDRVKQALNWALDVTDSGDSLSARLRDKLNVSVGQEDMLAALGF